MSSFYNLFILLLINSASLNASNFGEYFNNNNQVILASIIVIIFILAYSIYKIIKRLNGISNNPTGQKSVDEYLYLNDIIESAIKEYKVLESCVNIKDKRLLEKDIENKLSEAHIYLNIITDKIKTKIENFDLEEFIKEINYTFYDKVMHKEFNIITNSNISYSVIADKAILQDIFTLLALLQFKEHNLKNATANIELDKNENLLKITVKQGLDYNKNIQKALNNNLNPIYNREKKRYYGIYLYLINKLANKINGIVKIDILKNLYTIDISIPVNIEQLENKANLLLPKEFNSKKALIICEDDNLSSSIDSFLKVYNIKADIITDNKIVQMPNFTNYDILITNSTLLISIISDYLISIKEQTNLKIVSIESKDKEYKYQNNLVDFVLEKPILQSKIYKMILHLYHDEIINKTDNIVNSKKSSIINNSAIVEQSMKKFNKVLIADDDKVNLNLLKRMIEQFGINVTVANNGREAFDILKSDKEFDLIILDSIMPELNAYDTIKKIRSNEEYNSIPVIIHSSFSMQEHSIDTIFKLGFDSYLPKPFDMEKLQSILQRYLQINNMSIEKSNSRDLKKYYEEFIAIYGNSDKLLEKFVSENQKSQIESLLRDLKNISIKIDSKKLIESINIVEEKLKAKKELNSDIIYPLTTQIKESKNTILSKLS